MPARRARHALRLAHPIRWIALWLFAHPGCTTAPRPEPRATTAAPVEATTTAAGTEASVLDDPAVRAALNPCAPPDASGRCEVGCEMIAGRCRRSQGIIQIPTHSDGDAGVAR